MEELVCKIKKINGCDFDIIIVNLLFRFIGTNVYDVV